MTPAINMLLFILGDGEALNQLHPCNECSFASQGKAPLVLLACWPCQMIALQGPCLLVNPQPHGAETMPSQPVLSPASHPVWLPASLQAPVCPGERNQALLPFAVVAGRVEACLVCPSGVFSSTMGCPGDVRGASTMK